MVRLPHHRSGSTRPDKLSLDSQRSVEVRVQLLTGLGGSDYPQTILVHRRMCCAVGYDQRSHWGLSQHPFNLVCAVR
jgi:hypothetical protein